MARPVGMSALGIAGSLAGTAVKTAVNRSINQYQERRLDQQSKVDWCVRAIPGPAVGGSARNARSTRAHDDHRRRHERSPATRSRRRERETEHASCLARATSRPRDDFPIPRTFARRVKSAAAKKKAYSTRRLSLPPRHRTCTRVPSLVPASPFPH